MTSFEGSQSRSLHLASDALGARDRNMKWDVTCRQERCYRNCVAWMPDQPSQPRPENTLKCGTTTGRQVQRNSYALRDRVLNLDKSFRCLPSITRWALLPNQTAPVQVSAWLSPFLSEKPYSLGYIRGNKNVCFMSPILILTCTDTKLFLQLFNFRS